MFDRPVNIDNVVLRIKTNNVNDNVHHKTEKQVNAIAERIRSKLNGTDTNMEFYYKVGWGLSESVINNNIEQALKGHDPQRYFTWLCKRNMG